jgi:hypothetical protein
VSYVLVPLAAVGLLWYVNPLEAAWLPKCPFHVLTGLYCPGCGMTRSLHQLLQGHFVAAITMNPLVLFLVPFIACSFVMEISNALGRPMCWPRAFSRWYWVMVVVVGVFGVARNLPWRPFNLLAPH